MRNIASRIALSGVVLAALALLPAPTLQAQTQAAGQAEDMHGLKVMEIHPKELPTPFPLGISSGRRESLEFRSPEQMSAADRDLVAANQAEIVRRADLQGFGLGRVDLRAGSELGSWDYEQAMCPAFPDHVILEYSRNNGAGDVTLFSVVVPRGNLESGHVRVIPVQRRGYSLFTPAGSNALTLNDFNHIVKEEGHGLSPDWLSLGLCYAALAGGHVRAQLIPRSDAEEQYPLATPASLIVSRKGGAEVRFSDSVADAKAGKAARDWDLFFAQDGRLLKARHVAAAELRERPVAGTAMELKGTPVKGQVVDVPGPGK